MQLTVGVWNAEWARPRSNRGEGVRCTLLEAALDVICLTETYEDLLPVHGHIISSEPDYGYRIEPGRRKVAMWSQEPWKLVDRVGSIEMPTGRFVCGTTESLIGEIRVIGVCIPWKDAHVRTGRRDRQPWEDHIQYLRGLAGYLQRLPAGGPTIIVGDFNQRIPRAKAPVAAFDALAEALSGFTVATTGVVAPLGRQMIDHLAHSSSLVAHKVTGWRGVRPDGLRLSDHDGVRISLQSKA